MPPSSGRMNMVQLDVEVFGKKGLCRYMGQLGDTVMQPAQSALLPTVAASRWTMFRPLKMEAQCSSVQQPKRTPATTLHSLLL